MSELRNAAGLTEAEFLAQYKPGDYERPSVTVDMILVGIDDHYQSLKLLLIKRKNHPYMHKWAFPGGFVEMEESSFEAANRELEEETGLTGIYLEQLYTYSDPHRDPRMRVIDIAYLALLPVIPAKASDDATDAAWFDLTMTDDKLMLRNEERDVTIEYKLTRNLYRHGVITVEGFNKPELVSTEGLAFDMAQILTDTMIRIRNKAEYTDIVFNLMQKRFTLRDLQHVYELILGKHLYKKNFRDKIESRVVPTLDKALPETSKGTKPARLYEYKGM